MRKYIFSVLIALLSLPVIAQQQQSQAKVVLDRTADAFRKAGGVKADFIVKAVTNGLAEGTENGTIRLKGEKFVLKTSDVVTWFDGKTQWSYVAKNDEVNVSSPTQEELQQINPYTFLYMYQKGFSYKLGTTKTFRGKAVWEVILTAKDKKQELERITLFVTKDTYEPLYILLQQRGQQTRNEITVTSYQTRQNYADSVFAFDRKQYPGAEIIDLR
ncbi:LolA-like putative outer membrane lipoprotein chaperone [uncultured Bacteroides sp.]|uniref:LolA-like putative outer membrane lipoprotein chaperone n=1 Tax=uncultured Bacteroides sp. TaxID=162156 RepID=UPI0025E8BA41|nr:LolA-like putative outer membrane lipoprotein chaperone [uncultured Bacteroides sp.]